MVRKLKVIPVNADRTNYLGYAEAFDIISPTSWEETTASNVLEEQGVLGNVILSAMPMRERSFTFNWVGPKKEIIRVLNYFTKTNVKHFLLGNLSDQNVLTPGIMFNSRSMLTSVADHRKMPGADYLDYLPHYHGAGFNPGSLGVRVGANRNSGNNFSFVDNASGIEAFMYLPKNQSYTVQLLPVSHTSATGTSSSTHSLNSVNFSARVYPVSTSTATAQTLQFNLSSRVDTYEILSDTRDRVLRVTMKAPIITYRLSTLDGILNYIPPIIYKTNTSKVLDEYEDIPSLLRPVGDFVYNVISPNVAELTMNFKEVIYVTD